MRRVDASVYTQILKSTHTSFVLRLGRRDGNRETLLFDFPAMKLSSGSPAISGKNQDVMIDAGFQATMHATLGYTMLVQRFYYLPTSCRHRRDYPQSTNRTTQMKHSANKVNSA